MTHNRIGSSRTYLYKHLSTEEALKLDDLRQLATQLDKSYSGYFLLTQSEYCLLLPFLNPLVIAWNAHAYRQMCRTVKVSNETKRKMKRNLLVASIVGFFPIANIAFTRKFKCTTRNLKVLESQIQAEEHVYSQKREIKERVDNASDEPHARTVKLGASKMSDEIPLPLTVRRMFNKCPRFVRNQSHPHLTYASDLNLPSNRNSVVSEYFSPRTSIELQNIKELDFLSRPEDIRASSSSFSHKSSSGATLTEQVLDPAKRPGSFSANNKSTTTLPLVKRLKYETNGRSSSPFITFAKSKNDKFDYFTANTQQAELAH
ncbi:hypothetical protein GGI25_002894 [Coemansia spiralis]|uniref:Uncharacterized protein n=2 Tax=Coemansia TaxID=4863 RepID=A0A9W8G7S6_9FUNG|nr:hypothetical protein EDC05_002865 [Coemansia umbellata]KAJ2622252.1 hypothetical protein GGI26_003405 [Coemansia sp. RSA 1358]KAJ2677796.1 hypothetical protein GGI25_002894 [Coemansia spiralis]